MALFTKLPEERKLELYIRKKQKTIVSDSTLLTVIEGKRI